MNDPVYTIVGSDEAPAEGCPPVAVSAWKTDVEEAEDVRLGQAERALSAPPPYLYRGRKERCFVRPRKMRWRKG